MYLRANTGHNDYHYYKNNLLQVYGNSSVLIASIIALFFPGEWTWWILLIALMFDVLIPILWRSTLKYMAPTFEIETYHERFWLFIIIVLGESILGAITWVSREQLEASTLSIIFAAILLSFIHWWIYFEYVSQAEIIKKNIVPWTYLHLPLTLCFTFISSAVLYLVEHNSAGESHTALTILTICCIGVLLTVVGFQKITWSYSKLVPKKPQYIRHLIVPAILMLVFLLDLGLTAQAILWWVTISAMAPIIVRGYMLTINFKKYKLSQEYKP